MVVQPAYIVILYFVIAVDYFSAIGIEKFKQYAKPILIASLSTNLMLLITFKYSAFALQQYYSYTRASNADHWLLRLALPIGLSFHTFQSMSYTIDVYKGKQQAEKNLLAFANYVLFFPQLVAGPIERAGNLLHQFHQFASAQSHHIKQGLLYILYGLALKCIIADRVSTTVDTIWLNYNACSTIQVWLGAVLFAVQIYCDFFGYAAMAKGLAQIMGIQFSDNFNRPYLAADIQDFWRRWHISLSTWFRDYVYYPLGGSQGGKVNTIRNIIIVFALSGIWHGANYTFLAWGLLHGIALVIHNTVLSNTPTTVKRILMWLVVLVGWILFRSTSLSQAVTLIKKQFVMQKGNLLLNSNAVILALLLCVLLVGAESLKLDKVFLAQKQFYAKLLCACIIIYFLGIFNQSVFIYFQF
ncbi:MAG: hypothetical protein RL660_2032 [Bacteroidota bacterium]